MPKIPVLETIRAAYRFALAHLGAIIGLIWLPMIILTVIGFFVMQRFFAALADAFASNNFALVGPAVLGLMSFVLVGMLLIAMMAAPVAQLALGTRKAGALAHFAFGAEEWRLFRAGIGVAAFLFMLLLVISVGGAAVLGTGSAPAGLASQGLFLVCLVFFLLRFGFFIPMVAVAETGPVLPRSWILSTGNFWRLFAVLFALVVPVRLAMVAAELALEGPRFLDPKLFTSATTTAMVAAQLHAVSQTMPITAGILFLIAPLLLGLIVGAGAHAFRIVTQQADK